MTVKAPNLISSLFITLEFVLNFMVSCVQGTSFHVLVDLHGKASAGTTVQQGRSQKKNMTEAMSVVKLSSEVF